MAQNEEPNVAGQASHDAETGATESGTNTTQSSHQTPSHPPNTIRTAKLIGLKKGDEERMLNRLKRNALKQCQEVLDEYMACVADKRLTLPLCKPLAQQLNACVKQYTTADQMDELRTEYLEERYARLATASPTTKGSNQ